jgi:hypothetical protein
VLYRNTAFTPPPPGSPGAVDLEGPSGAAAAARGLLVAQVALWLIVVAVALRMRFGAPPAETAGRDTRPATHRHRGPRRPGAARRPLPADAAGDRSSDQGAVTVDDSAAAPGRLVERLVRAGGPGTDGEAEPGERRSPADRVPPPR